jgi:hypothetical protein
MSYLQNKGFYTNEPSPYDRPDFDSRVPGWGPVARAAGPERWAVGATPTLAKRTAMRKITAMRTLQPMATTAGSATTTSGGMPWWVWLAVPMALGGAALFAWDQGWFGKSAPAAK